MNPRIILIELTPAYVPFCDLVKRTMESSEGSIGMALDTDDSWLGEDFVVCKLHCDDFYCIRTRSPLHGSRKFINNQDSKDLS